MYSLSKILACQWKRIAHPHPTVCISVSIVSTKGTKIAFGLKMFYYSVQIILECINMRVVPQENNFSYKIM